MAKRLDLVDVYVCVECGYKVRVKRRLTGKKPARCEKCGGLMAKMVVLR